MNSQRTIYETLIGKRCSDSHWSKIKKLANTCNIPLDKDGLQVIVNLRKINPRYFSLYPEIQQQLTEMGEEITGDIGKGLTGQGFLNVLSKTLEISPNQSTVSRWFKQFGGFKKTAFYDRRTIMLIATNALIYKAKLVK